MSLRRTRYFLLLAFGGVNLASAQSHLYGVVGVGTQPDRDIRKTTGMAAVGGELAVGHGVGVGGEIGVVAGHTSFAAFSLNGSYHFLPSRQDAKIDPFVTGGYTRANVFFSGANIGNLGGGANFWFLRHFGLRLDFRDFLNTTSHIWVFRAGPAFR